VVYTFNVLAKTDTIYIDARNMQFADVKINGRKVKYSSSATQLKLFKGFKKGSNKLEFQYTATPKQTLYFVKDGQAIQIWTQGQGKYTSHWLPSFDDVNEKVVFTTTVTFDNSYSVIANGKLLDKKDSNGSTIWHYAMEKPMSSYLMMLAIGRFDKKEETSASGTALEYYYRLDDAGKYEPTYRYSRRMFDFLESEIGVKYPWDIYRQVPVFDFLYAGMENTTSTIFSQDFVVDSIGFNDRTYINVNAHELAHQWFGDLVTAQSSKHHWLQEGFATYYALLAEKELFGDDHFQYELYEMAERLQQASETDTIPVLNEKASSLTFYQKGAWALHVLHERVGHEAFRKAVKSYLEKYAYKTATTDDFIAEVNRVSSYDTAGWKARWLESGSFPVTEALELLSKNEFMQLYLKVGDLDSKRFAEKKPIYMQILQSNQYHPVKEEVIFQMADVSWEEKKELIRYAMQTQNVKLRQAIARTMKTIPADFTDEYITLLNDKSYVTREIALNVLCSRFPERKAEFLDKSDKWIGFNDRNLRILWLALAYTADGYHPEDKEMYYQELQAYAGSEYESSVRQNALANLLYIAKADPVVLQNLVSATLHHKWQFVKFGKDNIRKLLKKEGYRQQFEALLPNLPDAERKKLEQLLAEK
ncbi:aminopeptidase, partial [Nostoc linckia z16]